MRARRHLTALAIALVFAAPSASAAPSPTWTITTVDVTGGDAWRSGALEQTIRSELIATSGSTDEALALAFRGTLDPATDELRYTITDDAGVALARGVIAVGDTTMAAFRAALSDATHGLDAALARQTSHAASLAGADVGLSAGALVLVLLGCCLFVGSPLLIPIIGGCPLRDVLRLRSLRATLALWLGLGALAALAISGRLGVLAEAAWLIYIAGGVFWGWFVAANARVVFPTMHGLSRVEHRDVFRVLRLWAWVAVLRLLRHAAFYAPFVVALWLALQLVAPGASLSTPVVVAVVLPALGLLARFWFLSLVEGAAALLDRQLVVGEASSDSGWHRAVRGYFVGYIKRSAWEGGVGLLDRILFLPGRGSDITLYGGGLTHSRIVIGTELLEFALAPYGRPHDYEGPREQKLFWSGWQAGLMVPALERDKPIASLAVRAAGHDADPGEIPTIHLGQPPTLAGFVEPSALDSRRSHRPAEDPTWLEWDPGNDFDGTDPGDHDFLFGALVRELGLVHRGDDQRLTLATVLAPRLARFPVGLRRAGRALARPYQRLFGRAHAVLGDVYASLNHARHHLVQHLAWKLWREEDALTARAFRPELERQSERIYADLESREESADCGPSSASDRERLGWLSLFSQTPVTTGRARWLRRIGAAAIAAVLIAAIAHNVMRAINYHPTYVERTSQHD